MSASYSTLAISSTSSFGGGITCNGITNAGPLTQTGSASLQATTINGSAVFNGTVTFAITPSYNSTSVILPSSSINGGCITLTNNENSVKTAGNIVMSTGTNLVMNAGAYLSGTIQIAAGSTINTNGVLVNGTATSIQFYDSSTSGAPNWNFNQYIPFYDQNTSTYPTTSPYTGYLGTHSGFYFSPSTGTLTSRNISLSGTITQTNVTAPTSFTQIGCSSGITAISTNLFASNPVNLQVCGTGSGILTNQFGTYLLNVYVEVTGLVAPVLSTAAPSGTAVQTLTASSNVLTLTSTITLAAWNIYMITGTGISGSVYVIGTGGALKTYNVYNITSTLTITTLTTITFTLSNFCLVYVSPAALPGVYSYSTTSPGILSTNGAIVTYPMQAAPALPTVQNFTYIIPYYSNATTFFITSLYNGAAACTTSTLNYELVRIA